MSLFDEFKTPIFQDINDTPRSATETEASNGSDLISKVNSICDQLNRTMPEFFNKAFIFFDSSDTDYDSLWDDQYSVKSILQLEELLRTKIVNNEVTIFLITDFPDDASIDLSFLKVSGSASLIFKSNPNNLSSVKITVNSFQSFIENIPKQLNIKIENINFECERPLRIFNGSDINISNCVFSSLFNDNVSLLQVENFEKSEISDNKFTATGFSEFGGHLAFFGAINSLLLKDNNFDTSEHPAITMLNCNSDIAGIQSYADNVSHRKQNFIKAVNSNITLTKRANILPVHVINENSTVINKTSTGNSNTFITYYFDSLTDAKKVLIINPIHSFSIVSMHVEDDDSSASYDLEVNDLPITANFTTDKFKNYSLVDINNRLEKAEGSKLFLVVVGTANNITVQIEITSY